MSLAPESVRDLLDLFGAVETGVPPLPEDPLEPLMFTGSSDNALLFRGRSLYLLRNLQAQLAGSALAKGGPSRKAVENLLIEACQRSFTEGHEAAVSWLQDSLTQRLEEWLVVEPLDVYLPVERATLGACEIKRELLEDDASEFIREVAKGVSQGRSSALRYSRWTSIQRGLLPGIESRRREPSSFS